MGEAMEPQAGQTEKEPGKDSIGSRRLVDIVLRKVDRDTGMSATLRRLDPQDSAGVPALHAILSDAGIRLDPTDDDAFERHACCVRIIALLQRVNGQSVSVGRGLASIGVSEARLARLNTARGRSLRDLVTGAVRRTVSAGERIDARELCDLLLCSGRPGWRADASAEVRRRIMGDYYRYLDSEAAKASKASAA